MQIDAYLWGCMYCSCVHNEKYVEDETEEIEEQQANENGRQI
jgi:hypothetical protein